nr:hypothetical protein [Tanacetum cinerariifolium]
QFDHAGSRDDAAIGQVAVPGIGVRARTGGQCIHRYCFAAGFGTRHCRTGFASEHGDAACQAPGRE